MPTKLLSILHAAHAWSLSLTSLRVLIMIASGECKHSSELARLLGLTSAGIHCAFKPLVKRRILRKARDCAADERLVSYDLTTYGRSILDAILSGNSDTSIPQDPDCSSSSVTETPGAKRNRNTETPLPIPQ